MGKIVFLVLAAVALLWWFSARRNAPRPGPGPAAANPPAAEAMVRCTHCGVHLPRGDALFDGERPYCSETHRLAGPQPGGSR